MIIEMKHTGQQIDVDPSVAGRMAREGTALVLLGQITDREIMLRVLGHEIRPVPMSAERLRSAGI